MTTRMNGNPATPVAPMGSTTPARSANRTVAEVVRDHPASVETLKRLGINHCCGAGLSLKEAAAAAGVPLDTLLELVPPVSDPDVQVHVDVRDDLRRGEEPLGRIWAAARALEAHEVLVIRAPFEPLPLYPALARRGFAHWTDPRAADDWSVWFYRAPGPVEEARAVPPSSSAAIGSVHVDVRGLEPPQPLIQILDALAQLPAGAELEVVLDRRPLLLYAQLEARNFVHETTQSEGGAVRIAIRRAPASA